jgi:Glycine rich protein
MLARGGPVWWHPRSDDDHSTGELMRVRLVAVLALATAAAFAWPAEAFGAAAPTQFAPTGAQQVYTVPSGVLLEGLVVQGAWGGSADPQPPASQGIFAAGATLQGYLATTPGETLYAEVGQNGAAGGGATFGGGGGAGGGNDNPTCSSNGDPCAGAVAGSGGGASDVRTCSMSAASCSGGGSSLDSRLIVASGGGGDGAVSPGGCASGESFESAGEGQNNQLPTASAAGPAAIDTAAGIVPRASRAAL